MQINFENSSSQLNLDKAPITGQQLERVKLLEEEVEDLKSQIDKSQKLHNEKLKTFSNLIGIDSDLLKLMHAIPGSKESNLALRHREGAQKLQNIEQRNRELEQRLFQNEALLQEAQKVSSDNLSKYNSEANVLKQGLEGIISEMDRMREETQSTVQELVYQRAEELQKLLIHSHMLLEENTSVLHNLHFKMDSHAADIRNKADWLLLGRNEIETDLQNQFRERENVQHQKLEEMKMQHDNVVKHIQQQIQNFTHECNQYNRKKEEIFQNTVNEVQDLYAVILNQRTTIERVAAGEFNKGVKPVLIPQNDYPLLPSKQRFPNLFRGLTNKQAMSQKFTPTTLRYSARPASRGTEGRTARGFNAGRTLRSTFTQSLSSSRLKSAFNIQNALYQNVDDMNDKELREQTYYFQKAVRELKGQIGMQEEDINNANFELQVLEKQKEQTQADYEKFKRVYTDFIKDRVNQNIVVDSQKRLLDRRSYMGERMKIRPNSVLPHQMIE